MDWGWWEDKPPKKIFDGLVFSISLQNESMGVRKQVADAIKKNGGTVAIGQPKEVWQIKFRKCVRFICFCLGSQLTLIS